MTVLPEQIRGDTFDYVFQLDNGWEGSHFTGGLKFTLRTSIPPSSETDDDNAVDQASVGTGEITFDGTDTIGTILIPAERTTQWPPGRLVWDIQGRVDGLPRTYTIDSGEIPVRADITRSP